MILPRAALSALDVVLEVRVAGADLRDARERGLRERRAAEVRVHEHAGRVQDAAERRPPRAGELLEHRVLERPRLAARPDLRPRALEHGARGRRTRARAGSAARRSSARSRSTEGRSRSERGQARRSVAAPRSYAARTREELAQERGEPGLRLGSDLEHLLVTELPVHDARGHVRHDRDPEAADPHVPSRDHLRNRGHSREVAADRAHEADLRRRLELRPEPGRVHALADLDARAGAAASRAAARSSGSYASRHVREARPERVVVRPDERRRPLQVHVVGDEHELSRAGTTR